MKGYVKRGKTDAADAAAICEAMSRPSMRFVPVKSQDIVSPYIASVSEPIRAAFEAGGIAVPDMLSFGEQLEARVARIALRSLADAARALAQRCKLDALFLSCTNLRTLDILAPLSEELGLPVLSSNQCLAVQMAALAKITPATVAVALE